MRADRLFYVARNTLATSRLLLFYRWSLLRSRSLLLFTRYTLLMTLQAARLPSPVNRSKPLTISDLIFFCSGKGSSWSPQGPYVGPKPLSVHGSPQKINLGFEKVEASTFWKFRLNFIFFLTSNYLLKIWHNFFYQCLILHIKGVSVKPRGPQRGHCDPAPYLDSRIKSLVNSSLLVTCYSALFL